MNKIFKLLTGVLAAALITTGLLLAVTPALAFGPSGYFYTARTNSNYFLRYGFSGRGFRFSFNQYPYKNQTAVNSNSSTNLNADAQKVVSQASPAVVYVNAYKDMPAYSLQYSRSGRDLHVMQTQTGTSNQETSSGSGFFITASGYILTNKHVVSDTGATYMVSYNNNSAQAPATVVYRDPNNDLAIVKIDGSNFPIIPLGDSSSLAVGQGVVSIGNALGEITNYATYGDVINLNQNITVEGDSGTSETLQGVIQTNAKLYPGDSGGPLLNTSGQAVGLNTATVMGGRKFSASFYIPINAAKNAIASAGIVL